MREKRDTVYPREGDFRTDGVSKLWVRVSAKRSAELVAFIAATGSGPVIFSTGMSITDSNFRFLLLERSRDSFNISCTWLLSITCILCTVILLYVVAKGFIIVDDEGTVFNTFKAADRAQSILSCVSGVDVTSFFTASGAINGAGLRGFFILKWIYGSGAADNIDWTTDALQYVAWER